MNNEATQASDKDKKEATLPEWVRLVNRLLKGSEK